MYVEDNDPYFGGMCGSPCWRVLTVSIECISISPDVPPTPPAIMHCNCVNYGSPIVQEVRPFRTPAYMPVRRSSRLFLLIHWLGLLLAPPSAQSPRTIIFVVLSPQKDRWSLGTGRRKLLCLSWVQKTGNPGHCPLGLSVRDVKL